MSRTPMQFFEAISAIPRVSGNEKAVADFVEQLALAKGYEVRRDAMHNMVVVRPASPGCEHCDTFMMQGHLDMVAAAKEGVTHNFDTDPIELVRDGDLLRANGTTLGADDGVAVAYMLAILEDDSVVAPRLECVFTVQEESGLIGVQHFDFTGLKATKMLNLDAGPEGVLLVTNAGGCRLKIKRESGMEPVSGKVWNVTVSGLRGGNSTAAIQKEQANALILAGILSDALRAKGGRLVSLNGGEKENIMPTSVSMTVAFDGDIAAVLEPLAQEIVTAWDVADPEIVINWKEAEASEMMDEATSNAVIDLLLQLPQGILSWSAAFAGLIETTSNVGICKADSEGIEIAMSLRSASNFRKSVVQRKVSHLAEGCGACVEISGDYPGWSYQPESPLRELCIEVFEEQYGRKPSVEGVHAGLECGVFKAAMPHLDIVATGPLYKEMHTANEWLNVPSFERTYQFILGLLKRLAV